MEDLRLNEQKLDEERDKYYTNPVFRTGYKVFKGFTLPECFQEFQQEIEDFEVFDDDIWITTFPKCGTTWTQEMVWCISRDMDLESAKEDLDLRMSFLEFCCTCHPRDPRFKEYDPGYMHESIERARNSKRPRIIKTHLPFDLLPKQIQTFERQPKIIHVYRNIKDVCISFYHHARLIDGYRGDFELFWKLFITGKLLWTPMIDNILSYWQHHSKPNYLFLRFEDMKRDLRSVILDVCKFLGKSFKPEQMDQLVAHLSFDAMQKNVFVQKPGTVKYCEMIGARISDKGQFIRQGKAGEHKTEMRPEVIKIFDEYVAEKLKNSDFKFN